MFSTAKCGHCGKSGTKLEIIEPTGAAYKVSAICCQHCSAILGTGDYYNIGTLLKSAEKERKAVQSKIASIEAMVYQIASALRR